MPARKGDETGLAASGFTEVRKGDGTVLWQLNTIPDSQHRWPTDEGSGGTLTDSQGSQNGSLNGPDWVTGSGGNGDAYLDYPNSADYVGYGEVLKPSWSSLSVVVWAKFDSVDNTLVTQAVGTSSTDFLIFNNSGSLDYRFDGSQVATADISSTGGWHMVALTVDNGAATAYFDDGSVGSTSGLSTPSWSSDPFETGNRNAGSGFSPSQPWGDGIDDPAVWDSALSASQISDHYNNTVGNYP